MLNVIDSLPAGLLDAEAADLQRILGAPTLMHLPGRRPEPLFLSVLLHGNEDTGFYAVREVLRRYRDTQLPRALSVFFGNVAAAAQGLRHLDGQPDYNRVWPGADSDGTPEHAMMLQIVQDMQARKPFASIDVHNNTGLNPHYACVNRVDHRYLHLATLFARTVVYFTRPRGVQSLAFAPFCPAVTVECGQPGQPRARCAEGVVADAEEVLGVAADLRFDERVGMGLPHDGAHARDFIDACLHLADIPVHPVAPHDVDLFHTVAIVKVPERAGFCFGDCDAPIRLLPELDRLNFRELASGTALGWVRPGDGIRLEAWDERGRDVGERYFDLSDGQIRTCRPVMPSMFTLDERVIRQDCLGYLMERYELVAAED